jgi:hypothetical protein
MITMGSSRYGSEARGGPHRCRGEGPDVRVEQSWVTAGEVIT